MGHHHHHHEGYDEQHSIQLRHHHHHHMFRRKTIPFLPILCRLSIKDINLNNHQRRRNDPKRAADEPSSPKVSCMGQVKRNNRVAAVATTSHHHKYSKLKKLFSSKTLLPPPTTSTKSSTRREVCLNNNLTRLRLRNIEDDGIRSCSQQQHHGRANYKLQVNVGELDPPLPVVKKAAPPPDEANIWKRRFNGAPLKTLQLDQHIIHLPKRNFSQPPTV